jgi:hemolysin activation/secretion protein
MLKIDNNNKITLTRGDTLTLKLTLSNADGTEYVPESGDSLRFAISEGYENGDYYALKYEQSISVDTLSFTMLASETKKLEYKVYNYDIELTHADGTVDTVISSQIKIIGEVK